MMIIMIMIMILIMTMTITNIMIISSSNDSMIAAIIVIVIVIVIVLVLVLVLVLVIVNVNNNDSMIARGLRQAGHRSYQATYFREQVLLNYSFEDLFLTKPLFLRMGVSEVRPRGLRQAGPAGRRGRDGSAAGGPRGRAIL